MPRGSSQMLHLSSTIPTIAVIYCQQRKHWPWQANEAIMIMCTNKNATTMLNQELIACPEEACYLHKKNKYPCKKLKREDGVCSNEVYLLTSLSHIMVSDWRVVSSVLASPQLDFDSISSKQQRTSFPFLVNVICEATESIILFASNFFLDFSLHKQQSLMNTNHYAMHISIP